MYDIGSIPSEIWTVNTDKATSSEEEPEEEE
jgi:hypothetical protein